MVACLANGALVREQPLFGPIFWVVEAFLDVLEYAYDVHIVRAGAYLAAAHETRNDQTLERVVIHPNAEIAGQIAREAHVSALNAGDGFVRSIALRNEFGDGDRGHVFRRDRHEVFSGGDLHLFPDRPDGYIVFRVGRFLFWHGLMVSF